MQIKTTEKEINL